MNQIKRLRHPIFFTLPFLMAILIGTITPSAFAQVPDTDGDGIPDDLDVCPGFDDTADADVDGIPDDLDVCPGFDDTADADVDGIPDGCDPINNVSIDIKPGSDTNPLNCKSKGVTPFAIFMDQAGLEAIDVSNLQLNGATVTEKHGKVHLEDEDGDGVVDYGVVHLLTQEICSITDPTVGTVDVTLSDGSFEGTDTILILKR